MASYFKEICDVQKLLWANDDLMTQDILFQLQDKVANLALKIANSEKKGAELVKQFPFLYRMGE